MQKILLIGAGRSASSLIRYLLDHASECDWEITVADVSLEMAQHKTGQHPRAKALAFDMQDEAQRSTHIQAADLVISMLPATMHMPVAHDCVRYKKHLVTASYVSPAMKALHEEAKNAGIILMNEIGLDPGIDHASAMQIIDSVRDKGGEVVSFKSYCGGLVAPESNDNPWGYKFTWNPRAVVMAGQGGDAAGIAAQYMENGKVKYIPYTRLFSSLETVSVGGLGKFDAYANRDSLSYINVYGLKDVQNMYRGTLRASGFCKAWNALIQLGITDDSFKISNAKNLSYADFIEAFTPSSKSKIGLKKRGSLTVGHFADIVIFDRGTIRDVATIQNPYRYAEGIKTVVVNGSLVVDNGKLTGSRSGLFLRK